MRDHVAISSKVRPHPVHIRAASNVQTLMQGESKRGVEMNSSVMGWCAELWGRHAYSSNALQLNNQESCSFRDLGWRILISSATSNLL
jgi:hypothetical protein